MKTQLILTLYDKLTVGNGVDREQFCADFAISERTFYRYIREINLFIMRAKRTLVLKVDEPTGHYYTENSDD